MASVRYLLVFHGVVDDGEDLATVKRRLQCEFQKTPGEIERLFEFAPTILGRSSDLAALLRHKKRFERSGALCNVERIPEGSVAANSPPPPASSPHLHTHPADTGEIPAAYLEEIRNLRTEHWAPGADYWNDEWTVGIRTIDVDHKNLVGMINRLADASVRTLAIRELLPPLIRYTVDHFRTEESMMAATAYPHLERHRGEHQGLVQHVSKVGEVIREWSDPELPDDLENFLRDWLMNHIMKSDKRLGRHLRAHGMT
ncbi:MAG: hemerythrin family protein [Magnetococcales bacterium]|nr:hemerythrin family protein [Magnetococcales bacterium]